MKKILLISIVLTMGFATCGLCGNGETSMKFIDISMSAKPMSMGGAFAAYATGIDALNCNPAGLSRISNKELSLAHSEWIDDVNLEHLALGVSASQKVVFALGMDRLTMGDVTKRDELGNRTGDYTCQDSLYTFAMGWSATDRLSLGLAFKGVEERIDEVRAAGQMVDLGMQFRNLMMGINLGLSARNIGKDVQYVSKGESLPTAIHVSLMREIISGLAVVVEGVDMVNGDDDFRMGLEYGITSFFAMRAGYRSLSAADKNMPVTLGLSFGQNVYSLDYAYASFGELGDTHRFGLSYKWR